MFFISLISYQIINSLFYYFTCVLLQMAWLSEKKKLDHKTIGKKCDEHANVI